MDQSVGLAAIDAYGRGERDPVTGLFEWYDELPPAAGAIDETTEDISWPQLLSHWPILEGAFHATFGVDVVEQVRTRSWRWFTVRVEYLLAIDGPLSRLFKPDPA